MIKTETGITKIEGDICILLADYTAITAKIISKAKEDFKLDDKGVEELLANIKNRAFKHEKIIEKYKRVDKLTNEIIDNICKDFKELMEDL